MSYTAQNLDTVEIPKSSAGRPAKPNLLTEMVGKVASIRDKASQFTVPLTSGDADAAAIIERAIKRDLTAAGATHNVMVRRDLKTELMGKTPRITVTFWCVDKPSPKNDDKGTDTK